MVNCGVTRVSRLNQKGLLWTAAPRAQEKSEEEGKLGESQAVASLVPTCCRWLPPSLPWRRFQALLKNQQSPADFPGQ